jgi:hypothetical protein
MFHSQGKSLRTTWNYKCTWRRLWRTREQLFETWAILLSTKSIRNFVARKYKSPSKCRIWGSHSGSYECCHLLEYSITWTDVSVERITSIFRVESEQSKKTMCSRWLWISETCCLVRLIFDPEDGGYKSLRNVSSHADYIALYPRRYQHSYQVTDNYNYHIISLIRTIAITLPNHCIPVSNRSPLMLPMTMLSITKNMIQFQRNFSPLKLSGCTFRLH